METEICSEDLQPHFEVLIEFLGLLNYDEDYKVLLVVIMQFSVIYRIMKDIQCLDSSKVLPLKNGKTTSLTDYYYLVIEQEQCHLTLDEIVSELEVKEHELFNLTMNKPEAKKVTLKEEIEGNLREAITLCLCYFKKINADPSSLATLDLENPACSFILKSSEDDT